MKLLEINVVCGIKSTGRIATEIAKEYESKGYDVKIAYGREDVPEEYQKYAVRIGSKYSTLFHALCARLLDNAGFGSCIATKRFLRWAEEYNPDVLWLHNLHGYYINVEMLFKWIKSRPDMEVKWTLHDCWAFTGHCTYFTAVGCNKWMDGCSNCPQKREYPASVLIDNSTANYKKKKETFKGVNDLKLYSPSEWLKCKIKKSFLQEYEVEVQPNTVDRETFVYTESNIRKQYGISKDKKLIVSVASTWTRRKGLSDLIALSKMLDKSQYALMVVGLNREQLATIPDVMIGVPSVDITELVKIYSAADLLVSTSKEETFGMTILEAAACGTKSIVYKDTACEEVALANGGKAVEMDAESLRDAIITFWG